MNAIDGSPIVWESGSWHGLRAARKPPGLPVFPPHYDPSGDSLLRRIDGATEGWTEGFAGGIAHRLDTPTSGQVLVAETPEALAWVRPLFAQHRLVKTYVFLSLGGVPWSLHEVKVPLAHDARRKARMTPQRGASTPHRGAWLKATTTFQRIAEVGAGLTAWQATMSTGVMHQIRLHAAFSGIPIVGDRLYGGGDALPWAPWGFVLHHVGVQLDGDGPPPCPLPPSWPEALVEPWARYRRYVPHHRVTP